MKASDFAQGGNVDLDGVSVKWAKLIQPDTKFEPAWKVTAVISEEKYNELLAGGFNVKEDKDGDKIIECKRKCVKRDGTPMTPPNVVGRDGRTAFTELLGNGTVCNLRCAAREYKPGKVAIYLNDVQVVEHVEFNGAGGFNNLDA